MVRELKDNSFYLVSLLVATILFLSDQLGFLQWYKDIYTFVTYPVVSVSHSAKSGFDNGLFSILYSTSLTQENNQLKGKVLDLETKLSQLQQTLDANKMTADTIRAMGQLTYKKTVHAMVLDTSVGNLSGMIQLNKGASDGLKVGMPVVVEGNYFGIIESVTNYTSICRTLDIPGQSMIGYILKRKLTGTVKTDIGQISLRDLLATETVQIQDSVATTLPNYPYFFPVGIISQAPANNGSAERIGVIKSNVAVNAISLVTIILE